MLCLFVFIILPQIPLSLSSQTGKGIQSEEIIIKKISKESGDICGYNNKKGEVRNIN